MTKDDLKALSSIINESHDKLKKELKSTVGKAQKEFKSDLRKLKKEIQQSHSKLKNELKGEIDLSHKELKSELRSEMNLSHSELKSELRSEMGSIKDELMFEIRKNGVAIEQNGHRIDLTLEGVIANQEAIKRIQRQLGDSDIELIPVHSEVIKRHSKKIKHLEGQVFAKS